MRTARGWVYFDGECPLCRRWTALLRPHAARRGFRFAALQHPAVRRQLAIDGPVPDEFKLRLADGQVIGGADAALKIASAIEWAAPLAWLARAVGLRPLLRALYRLIARRRHCHLAACPVPVAVARPRPRPRATPRKRAFDAAWIGALAMVGRRHPR